MYQSALLIGIGGGSGSGKSTFAKQLAETIAPFRPTVISSDGFFKRPLPKMISPASGKEYDDWNSPESIDSVKMIESVKQKCAEQTEKAVVIVEGLSVLYFPELQKLFDLKVFVDLDSDKRMYRRIKRNMSMWGVSMEEVADYYLESAKYGEERYFLPTRQCADIVINGESDFTKPVSVISAWVQGEMGK